MACLRLRISLGTIHKSSEISDMIREGECVIRFIFSLSLISILCSSHLASAGRNAPANSTTTRPSLSTSTTKEINFDPCAKPEDCQVKTAPEFQQTLQQLPTMSVQQYSTTTQMDPLIQQCSTATEEARKDCTFDDNPTVQTVMAMASGLKKQLEQGAAASQAALCSQAGSMAQAIDGAVAAFSGYCSSGFAKCSDTCESSLREAQALREIAAQSGGMAVEQVDEKISKLKESRKKCTALAANIQNVAENISNYTQLEKMKSQSCGQQVGGVDAACQANPLLPACQQKLGANDCSNPSVAASSTVCICQRNPSDSRCGGGAASFGSGSNYGAGTGGAGGSGTDGKLSSFGGLGGDFGSGSGNAGEGKAGGAEGGSLAKGGGGRSNLDTGGGGTGGGAGGHGGGGPAGAGANTKVIGGYGFGSGGGMGMGGYGSGSNGNPSQAGYYGRGGMGANGKPVDLRQFMPGGKMDPSRALAGVSGPDGITGPNTDIWKKINVRYFSVSPTLLP
jgi:hypothetical protein